MSMVRSVIRNCYGIAEDSTEPFQSSPRPSYGKLIILIPFQHQQPRTKPVETHYKNTYFLQSPCQNCYHCKLRDCSPLPYWNIACGNTRNAHVSCQAKTTLHKGWGGGQICSVSTRWLHVVKLKITWKCLNSFVQGCSSKSVDKILCMAISFTETWPGLVQEVHLCNLGKFWQWSPIFLPSSATKIYPD